MNDTNERMPQAQPGQTEAGAPGAAAPAEDEVTALRREMEALRDRNLRLLAEVQNSAKRAERDKQEALRFAEADFAKDLLPVLDDLERTLGAAARAGGDAKPIAEGVRIVYEHLLKVLRARQIVPIDAVGQPFDSAQHEAMLLQASDEHPSGVVVQELARGYKMHERVLRPTRAIISSGPAAPAEADVPATRGER